MDPNLLPKKAQPATSQYLGLKLQDLRDRGYSDNEVEEIKNRAFSWLAKNLEKHPALGLIVPLRKDIDRAITETLDDSIDIAAGLYA